MSYEVIVFKRSDIRSVLSGRRAFKIGSSVEIIFSWLNPWYFDEFPLTHFFVSHKSIHMTPSQFYILTRSPLTYWHRIIVSDFLASGFQTRHSSDGWDWMCPTSWVPLAPLRCHGFQSQVIPRVGLANSGPAGHHSCFMNITFLLLNSDVR